MNESWHELSFLLSLSRRRCLNQVASPKRIRQLSFGRTISCHVEALLAGRSMLTYPGASEVRVERGDTVVRRQAIGLLANAVSACVST